MHRIRTAAAHLAAMAAAVAAGCLTMAVLAYAWLPPGVVAVVGALGFIVMLPRRPRLVVAFAGGVGLAVVVAVVAMANPGWVGCADVVAGQLVEYRCSEGPPGPELKGPEN